MRDTETKEFFSSSVFFNHKASDIETDFICPQGFHFFNSFFFSKAVVGLQVMLAIIYNEQLLLENTTYDQRAGLYHGTDKLTWIVYDIVQSSCLVKTLTCWKQSKALRYRNSRHINCILIYQVAARDLPKAITHPMLAQLLVIVHCDNKQSWFKVDDNSNESIKTISDAKMNMLILCASHFIADFNLLVLLTMLLSRNNTFMLNASQINFQAAEDFRATDIISDQFAFQKHVSSFSREKPKQTTSKDVTAEIALASSRKKPVEDVVGEERIKNSKPCGVLDEEQSAKSQAALLLSHDGCSSVEKVDKTEEDALRNGSQDARKKPQTVHPFEGQLSIRWSTASSVSSLDIVFSGVLIMPDLNRKMCLMLTTHLKAL
ncbi:hypothetical protein EDC96DRAFT_561538 [Choanephora cucurbitarum]|nr:hypothetical protein EDC96DRAFT_561538 [Choanephora cucurbitarum]